MIAKVSELFVTDIEYFIGNLQALKAYTDDIIRRIQTRNIIAYDILQSIESLSKKVCTLETVISLMKRRAQKFRPDNINLHQALNDIEKDIKRLGSDIWTVYRIYQNNLNFDINKIYEALMDISAYANLIRLKIDSFIQDGVFM